MNEKIHKEPTGDRHQPNFTWESDIKIMIKLLETKVKRQKGLGNGNIAQRIQHQLDTAKKNLELVQEDVKLRKNWQRNFLPKRNLKIGVHAD